MVLRECEIFSCVVGFNCDAKIIHNFLKHNKNATKMQLFWKDFSFVCNILVQKALKVIIFI